MSRDSFLARVRDAAAAGRKYRIRDYQTVDPAAGRTSGDDDLPARMAKEVELAGGCAHLVNHLDAARDVLSRLLTEAAPKSALCWQHPVLDRLRLEELLAGHGIEAVTYRRLAKLPRDEQRSKMLAAGIGITGTTLAIAETGTLAVASSPGSERLASLVPPIHVAIVERNQIVPDLFDLFGQHEADPLDSMPTNLTLITGPSKTGDLELRLTTGVHGPGECHVIVVR